MILVDSAAATPLSRNRTEGAGSRARALSILLAIASLPAAVWLSGGFGVTWDELQRQAYGERIWAFYQERVGYQDFPADGSHLYGGLFDFSAVALQQIVPADPYRIRHGLNAVVGWMAVVFTGALAARVYGPRAGLLAMVLLALSPRFLGHSMNNPKDLPFAAAVIAALYVVARMPRGYPWLPPGLTVWLALAVGLALSIRPGGVLVLAYAGAALAWQVLRSGDRSPRHLTITAGMFVVVALGAATVPLPFWPWLQQHPIVGLAEAVEGVSRFEWFGMVLFDGRAVRSTELPWRYVPTWLLYTTPPVVLTGLALSLGRLAPGRAATATGALWLAFLFPIAYVIARHSILYDGVRHLLFIYPGACVLAAGGWHWILERWRGRARVAVAAVLVVGLAEPLVFSIRNHPNEVVYFNAILGGPQAALGRFELDYWGNCEFEAMKRAARAARAAGMFVVMSGRQWRQMQLNAQRLDEVAVIDPVRRRHHLELTLLRGTPDAIAETIARPENLYRVTTADGTPLCIVSPGPAWGELERRLEARSGLDILIR